MLHVAVLHQRYLDAILDGSKTVESRLSRSRIAPFGVVRPGERVLFKASGGGFGAAAIVRRVEFHEALLPGAVRALRRRVGAEVGAPGAYWQAKRLARYATLIWLGDVEPLDQGPALPVLAGRAWVCVEESGMLRFSASAPARRLAS